MVTNISLSSNFRSDQMMCVIILYACFDTNFFGADKKV